MLLFLALMIVYIVRYQLKGNELKQQLPEISVWSGITIISIDENNELTGEEIDQENITETIVEGTTGMMEISEEITIQDTGMMIKNNEIIMLSWTKIYYGKIDIIEKLWIKYQYALTDTTGIWYIYLGTPSYDFASIARALKGTTYTMATEQEILENKLFGNKVVFINLPEYKDKQVVMLIYMNDGIWLIQVDYSIYHKSKSHIKSLFIN